MLCVIFAVPVQQAVKFLFDRNLAQDYKRRTFLIFMKQLAESAADIIAYYRQKSSEYAKKADDMEAEFLKDSAPSIRVVRRTEEPPAIIPASIEDVARELSERGSARPAIIAEALGVSREAVLATLESDPAKFTRAGQGWFKLTSSGILSTI